LGIDILFGFQSASRLVLVCIPAYTWTYLVGVDEQRPASIDQLAPLFEWHHEIIWHGGLEEKFYRVPAAGMIL
jgi:hypothetical protein